MKKKYKHKEISSLMSLLKVFDANYATNEDCDKLDGLNPNEPIDIAKAVNLLLIPELSTHSSESRKMLMNILQRAIASPNEDFVELFEEFGSVFDDEIVNPREFMSAILNALEAAQD